MRDHLLRGVALTGAAALALTELLSPFHLLRRGPLIAAWALLGALAVFWTWRKRTEWRMFRFQPVETAACAAAALIAGVVALVAALSPPNSADALAYHMPRVIYWAQAGSVAFFPTPYLNQIMLQPLAEYLMLHSYLLSGGDHWVALLSFAAFAAALVAASSLAGALGLGSKGQAFAALYCATLPSAILQGSGAKNDMLLALWLLMLLYFAVRRDALFAGICLGLALATKGTAYLFVPPLAAAAWLWAGKPFAGWKRAAPLLLLPALALNAPQYWRNLELSGSPVGFDSAHGDGFFRWRNERITAQAAVSNALRHASEQLGARSAQWNQRVYGAVLALHRQLGLDPQDPATTWRWSRYQPPVNAKNHEADANSRAHLLLLLAATLFAAATRRWWWLGWCGALAVAFLLFCLYLKWQPYMTRLELPMILAGAPLAAMALEAARPRYIALAICLLLVNNTRPPLFENWIRPLRGPHSVFAVPREKRYFADMGQWNNEPWYWEAVRLTAESGCHQVAIDSSIYQLEYPFQALLLARDSAARFSHVGVANPSARYTPAYQPSPCAVFCMECLGNREKINAYSPVGPPAEIGRFLLFLKPR